MDTWTILVTAGTVIEYPPEAYESLDLARDEARRWAWILSGMGWLPVQENGGDRWAIGDREVRLVRAEGGGGWIGTFWTWDGYPEPEAALFDDRDKARSWAVAPLHGALQPVTVHENDWTIVATFEQRGEEAYAVVHKLKHVVAL
jgi:hypothetical protein